MNLPLIPNNDHFAPDMEARDASYWRNAYETLLGDMQRRSDRTHRLVIIESPFAGRGSHWMATTLDANANKEYARAAVRDAILRGESPVASHLLFTQSGILNDNIPHERQAGIDAGLAWKAVADCSVVYTDRGITPGMEYGIAKARIAGVPVEFRQIQGWR